MAREFGISPREARDQDAALVEEIMDMRLFAKVYEKSQRDKKNMTPEEWAYLESVQEMVADD